jgi:hypothetical protein
MDRSRLGALPDVRFARTADATTGAVVVVVDLARYATAIPTVRATTPTAWIVAFGSHVDDAALARARRDGADVVMARSRFFRDVVAAVTPEPHPGSRHSEPPAPTEP